MLFSVPRINAIEEQKEELVEKYEHLKRIQWEWLSYGDLKTESSKAGGQDNYTKILLGKVDKEFYNSHFLNTWGKSYSDFLEDIEAEILTTKNGEEYKQREDIFNKILPYYTSNEGLSGDWLTDFHFVNYVEKLLYTFNLQSEWDIWVGKIERVNKDEIKESLLEEDIYKIPLNFRITWRKWDTFEFLHFLENVGSIIIEDEKTKVYEDDFIKRIFQWDEAKEGYNIYTRQIVDIESLTFWEYPDSSSIKNEQDFIDRMKWEQSREKVELGILVNFYVAGLPWYKMEWYVTDFLLTYDALLKEILSTQNKYKAQVYDLSEGRQIQAVSTLESLIRSLNSLDEDILDIRKELAKRENIEELYDDVVWYNKQLMQIEKKYMQQKDLLIK